MSAVGNASLDGIAVMQTSETVWAYPDNVTVVPLLSRHVSSTGNAVLQSSGLTVLTKQIGFTTADRSDAEVLYAARYDGAVVVYVDPDGVSASVVITTLSAQRDGNGLYVCAATLVQSPSDGS